MLYVTIMSVEQRTNIKFCVKLGKMVTETFNMLLEVYGDSCMSRTRVFEWHKRFVDGQLSVEDDAKPGRPCSVKTDVNIKKGVLIGAHSTAASPFA